MVSQDEYLDRIDDYIETIQAIVGFANFYRWDDNSRSIKNNVVVFQGKKFRPSKKEQNNIENDCFITPDIAIYLPNEIGVLGEVKSRLPKDKNHWMDTFTQLMKYDDDLLGWPSQNGCIQSHDIALIVHVSRSADLKDYFEVNKSENKINFRKNFSIIEFTRSDERRSYIFFRKYFGDLSNTSINNLLKSGKQVPMDIFIKIYSTVKIIDFEPPLPYLMNLIWRDVVLNKANQDPRFSKLRRNQKIETDFEIDEIIEQLYKGYSFYCINQSAEQPKIPRKGWILKACEQFVKTDEAKWIEENKNIKFFFKKYDNTQSHFIERCLEEEENNQMKLFDFENGKDIS